jgi:hypothetical protein
MNFWDAIKRVIAVVLMIIVVVLIIIAICAGQGWTFGLTTGFWGALVGASWYVLLLMAFLAMLAAMWIDPDFTIWFLNRLGEAAGKVFHSLVEIFKDVAGGIFEGLGLVLTVVGGFIVYKVLTKKKGDSVVITTATDAGGGRAF